MTAATVLVATYTFTCGAWLAVFVALALRPPDRSAKDHFYIIFGRESLR